MVRPARCELAAYGFVVHPLMEGALAPSPAPSRSPRYRDYYRYFTSIGSRRLADSMIARMTQLTLIPSSNVASISRPVAILSTKSLIAS